MSRINIEQNLSGEDCRSMGEAMLRAIDEVRPAGVTREQYLREKGMKALFETNYAASFDRQPTAKELMAMGEEMRRVAEDVSLHRREGAKPSFEFVKGFQPHPAQVAHYRRHAGEGGAEC